MSISQSIREQLLSSFRAELNEHIQVMNNGLLAIEQEKQKGKARQDTLHEIFRAAHSLKGAARSVGATTIEQLAHKLESVLDGLRNQKIEASAVLFNTCYQALDAVQVVHGAYEAGETTPPSEALKALIALEALLPHGENQQTNVDAPALPTPSAEPPPSPSTSDANSGAIAVGNDTIRVSVAKLDALMTHLSELMVAKTRSEERLMRARELQELLALWQRDWYSVRSAYSRTLHQDLSGTLRRLGPVEKGNGSYSDSRVMGKDILRLLDYLESSQERLSEAATRINGLVREYDADTTQMSQVLDELGEEIKRVNMLPLNTITGSFGRMVRDLAQGASKQAVLNIVGGDTQIDKRVLEQIKDPLIHMLRNAIDHGIESPEERQRRGKSPEGIITLTAEQLGKDVVICVSDDGAGLDLEGIRQAITRQDKTSAEALSDTELKEAIFRMGISTSRIITDISGRGVGLDIVRKNVEALNGSVEVDWTPGNGSNFTLTLPLRLTSSRGLLVQVSDQTFAIPINTIERIVYISTKDIHSLEGRSAIHFDNRPITLVNMSDVIGLGLSSKNNGKPIPVVVLRIADRCMAFTVDELLGEQEVVIKGLGTQLVRVSCIAGCTIMGNGEIVLILNVTDLFKVAARDGHHSMQIFTTNKSSPKTEVQRRILVVDDSITTRTLEKNILETAGYTVEVATNGQEALNMVKANGIPDLMVVDVIMPLMNGFELTQKVKNDPQMAHLPIILITSLDSAEDKARGIEVGAEAYIVKSRFDQHNLLETIEQLI